MSILNGVMNNHISIVGGYQDGTINRSYLDY